MVFTAKSLSKPVLGYAFQSSSTGDKMIEKVCGTDFKTLLSPAYLDTYQKEHFSGISLHLLG